VTPRFPNPFDQVVVFILPGDESPLEAMPTHHAILDRGMSLDRQGFGRAVRREQIDEVGLRKVVAQGSHASTDGLPGGLVPGAVFLQEPLEIFRVLFAESITQQIDRADRRRHGQLGGGDGGDPGIPAGQLLDPVE